VVGMTTAWLHGAKTAVVNSWAEAVVLSWAEAMVLSGADASALSHPCRLSHCPRGIVSRAVVLEAKAHVLFSSRHGHTCPGVSGRSSTHHLPRHRQPCLKVQLAAEVSLQEGPNHKTCTRPSFWVRSHLCPAILLCS